MQVGRSSTRSSVLIVKRLRNIGETISVEVVVPDSCICTRVTHESGSVVRSGNIDKTLACKIIQDMASRRADTKYLVNKSITVHVKKPSTSILGSCADKLPRRPV